MITVTKKFREINSIDRESTITISASAETVREAMAIITLEYKRYLLDENLWTLHERSKTTSEEMAKIRREIKEIQ